MHASTFPLSPTTKTFMFDGHGEPETTTTNTGVTLKTEADIMAASIDFFCRAILAPSKRGCLPTPVMIERRRRVFLLMTGFGPDAGRSLRDLAKELGCTRSNLSKISRRFKEEYGIRAIWQRSDEVCSANSVRQKAVAAGSYVPAELTTQRKLRAAKKAELAALAKRVAEENGYVAQPGCIKESPSPGG